MAQILKDETRNKIIDAAKQEFLEKGYKEASLRHIALRAHMTVGNLYRYFDSKEDLNNKICEPCLLEIESLLNKGTNNQLSFFKDNEDFKMDEKEMLVVIDKIINNMIDVFDKYPNEFLILMMDSNLNFTLKSWFSNLISILINNNYKVNKNMYDKLKSMSDVYACSTIAGFKELLMNEKDISTLKILSKIYFRSYVFMLNSDIEKMIKSI